MDLTTLKMPAPVADTAKAAMSPEETKKRAKITEAAKSFETSFLSTMMQSMFSGVTAGAFGGGAGEDAFKSMLIDAFAKQTVKAGGIGLSAQVGREMLKLQGLS
jgi:flagellar protein FlgJ